MRRTSGSVRAQARIRPFSLVSGGDMCLRTVTLSAPHGRGGNRGTRPSPGATAGPYHTCDERWSEHIGLCKLLCRVPATGCERAQPGSTHERIPPAASLEWTVRQPDVPVRLRGDVREADGS